VTRIKNAKGIFRRWSWPQIPSVELALPSVELATNPFHSFKKIQTQKLYMRVTSQIGIIKRIGLKK
jgi:hypothetical protein